MPGWNPTILTVHTSSAKFPVKYCDFPGLVGVFIGLRSVKNPCTVAADLLRSGDDNDSNRRIQCFFSLFKGRIPAEKSKSSKFSNCVATDDLFEVMQKAYSDDPSHKFIRTVNAATEPAVVVSTNCQLKDLSRFCTSSFEFSVLTVDPTFNLGEFDVTLTTFRHLYVQSKRYKQPPVFISPACINFKKTFSTYVFFASTMIGQCRELAGIRAIGTDGEKALIDAFKHEIGFSIHVHQNVKQKLHEYNIPSENCLEILNDIFGNKVGTTYIEGLVDAVDSNDLDEKVERLIAKWSHMELCSSSDMNGFINWFETYKVPVLRGSMTRDHRELCGLECPPIPFTTNASETANSVLKERLATRKASCHNFWRN